MLIVHWAVARSPQKGRGHSGDLAAALLPPCGVTVASRSGTQPPGVFVQPWQSSSPQGRDPRRRVRSEAPETLFAAKQKVDYQETKLVCLNKLIPHLGVFPGEGSKSLSVAFPLCPTG